MSLKLGILFLAIGFLAQTATGVEADWSWVQNSKDKTTNAVVWELKKLKFLQSQVPSFAADFGFTKNAGPSRLDQALLEVLGGPSDPVQFSEDQSAVLSACRAGSCDEKGFYWARAQDKTSALAILHFVYQGHAEDKAQLFLASKNFNCDAYPEVLKNQIRAWLKSKNLAPQKLRCLWGKQVFESFSL